VRLNAKYMINIAASRGLFGDNEGASTKEIKKAQTGRQQRRKPDLQRSTSGSPLLIRPQSRRLELQRFTAPTQASILRRASSPGKRLAGGYQPGAPPPSPCPRHQDHCRHDCSPVVRIHPKMVAQIRRQDARNWWREAAGYVVMCGFDLERAHNPADRCSRPALKLSRTRPYYKVPLHISVASIQLDESNGLR
jgi:hypothetical protein